MVASRSVTAAGSGDNQMYGADGSFTFFENVCLAGYLARTTTTGLSGKDYSYRGNFSYAGDRYGVLADHTSYCGARHHSRFSGNDSANRVRFTCASSSSTCAKSVR